MPIVTSCPVCSASQSKLFLDGEDDDLAVRNVGSSRTKLSHGRILRCERCSFRFRQLRPYDHELASLYRDANDEVYEEEMPGRYKTGLRHRAIVRKYHPGAGRLLDVGCASGAFLRTLSDAGWKVYGVEPSNRQFERARRTVGSRGILQNCTLQQADLPGDFDIVTLWDVLEHVTEPVQFMRDCCSRLKPGGHLLLNVPDIDSLQARLLRNRWPLLLSEHLNYFNRRSMKICGERAGLKSISYGRRPVAFSVGYVFYRLSQHGITGTKLAHKLLAESPFRSVTVPVWMGELLSVWQRPL